MADVALSIVVPVHNDARNLAICLAALRGADLQPLEMIVVDDASEEDIFSIANHARSELPATSHAKRAGSRAQCWLADRRRRHRLVY